MKIIKNGRMQLDKKKQLRRDIDALKNELSYLVEQQKRLERTVEKSRKTWNIVDREVVKLNTTKESIFYFFYNEKKKERLVTNLESKSKQRKELRNEWKQDVENLANTHAEIDKIKSIINSKNIEYDEMNIDCVDFENMVRVLEGNAWYRCGDTSLLIQCGNDVIKLHSYVYEPIYEDFTTTTEILLNGECLFGKESYSSAAYRKTEYDLGKFTSLDDAIDFIEDKFDGCEVELVR